MSVLIDLDYAPQSSPRRRLYRRAFWFVAIGGVVCAAWLWGSGVWRWARFLYWQHECLVYSSPPNHLVFDDDATVHIEPAAALMRFEKLGGDTRYSQNATILLHEMRSPDGSTWLVSLSCIHFEDDFTVMQEARRPQSFVDPSCAQYVYCDHHFEVARSSLRVFAGQIDPENSAHATFMYEVGGEKRIMDAWLKDGGEMLIARRPGS